MRLISSKWRGTLSRCFAVAFAFAVLLAASEARAQDGWRDKFAVVERLMSEALSFEKKAELELRWAAIAENARLLRMVESGSVDDAARARLDAQKAAEDRSRRSPSSTLQSNRNEGNDNWTRADKLVKDWAASGEPITLARLIEINTELRRQSGSDAVYAGGRNAALAVPDANTDEALAGFMKWFEGAQKELDPIELAGRAYQRLVTIHPLQDANGRTSRLLMDWILEKAGLPAVALDHAVATSAISDPFVFGGREEDYTGRPLKIVENLTQNLERVVRARLEATGHAWGEVPAKPADGLPLPETAAERVARVTGSLPGVPSGEGPARTASTPLVPERAASRGLANALADRVHESTGEDAIDHGAR